MKKFLMVWLPLLLIVAGGVGVGMYFLKSADDAEAPVIVEEAPEFKEKTVAEVYANIESISWLKDYETTLPSMTQLSTGTEVVLFAPTKEAVDTFVKDTALSVEKFVPYHIVVSETALSVDEGAKLKTLDGQEIIIVKKEGDLYARDAKGNDARLRKPVQAKNGRIYIIDRVLLTQ